MKSVRVTKRIGAAGDSLIIPITKEAKEFELGKGDEISVIIGTADDAAGHDYDFARMLSNPNGSYENTRWLTPIDSYLDGTQIPDHYKEAEKDDVPMADISLRLRVWSEVSRIIKDYTRTMASSKYSRYSDSMHSFITEFDENYYTESQTQVMSEQLFLVQLIDEIVRSTRLFSSPLKSVSSIADHLTAAVTDAQDYCDAIADEDMNEEETLQLINAEWDAKVSGKRYPDMWYVVVEARFPIVDNYPEATGYPVFHLVQAPGPQYVMDIVREKDPEGVGPSSEEATMSDILGPYKDQDDAQDMLSHFRLTAKSRGWKIDDTFIDWCKEQSHKIMKV